MTGTGLATGNGKATTGLRLRYPVDLSCGLVTSLFGSWDDLDGSRRDAPHEGIDLGRLGDRVIAPASGTITAIWQVKHDWGNDWNVLITHLAADLNMADPARAYYTEFDHLRQDDIAHLQIGVRVERGAMIGVVRHPGNNPKFRAEVHMENYVVPYRAREALSWRQQGQFRYWWNDAAELVDPLSLLAMDQTLLGTNWVTMPIFQPGADYSGVRGLTYPLSCASR